MRPSPNQHASETKAGTVLRGNDRRFWICKTMSNKTNRWIQLPDLTSGKSFITHDNGGSPYKVHIDKTTVTVFEQDDDLRDSVWELTKAKGRKERDKCLAFVYVKKVYQIRNARKVYVGEYKGRKYKYSKLDKGNSVLVQLTQNKFAFIGNQIFTFKAKDMIESYQSPIGNSDVPYPWASGKTFTYLLTENLWLENSEIKVKDDPYSDFYLNVTGSKSKKVRQKQSLLNFKVIHARRL